MVLLLSGPTAEEGTAKSSSAVCPTKCYKCQSATAASIEIRQTGCSLKPCCSACYITHIEGTFRSSLRTKCHISRESSPLSLALSGGDNSWALLCLLLRGLQTSSSTVKIENSPTIHKTTQLQHKAFRPLGCQLGKILYVDLLSLFEPYRYDVAFERSPTNVAPRTQVAHFPPVRHFQFSHHFLHQPVKNKTNAATKGYEQVADLPLRERVVQGIQTALQTLDDTLPPLLCVIDPLDILRSSIDSSAGALNKQNIATQRVQEALRRIADVARVDGRYLADLEQLLNIIKTRALVAYITQHQGATRHLPPGTAPHEIILCGETTTRCVTESLAYLTRGSGGQVPLVSGYLDERFGSSLSGRIADNENPLPSQMPITFARPLRKLLAEEINAYLKIQGTSDTRSYPEELFTPFRDAATDATLAPSSFPPKDTLSKNSAFNLVDSFIHALQSNNPQTVAIAAQTFEKLKSKVIDSQYPHGNAFIFGHCHSCYGPLESSDFRQNQVAWSRTQIQTLKAVFPLSNNEAPCPYELETDPRCTSVNLPPGALQRLCFGCLKLASTADSIGAVPANQGDAERLQTVLRIPSAQPPSITEFDYVAYHLLPFKRKQP